MFRRASDVNIEDVRVSDSGPAFASEWSSKGFIFSALIVLCLSLAGLSIYWLTPSRPRTLSEIEKNSSIDTSGDVKVGSDKNHKAKKMKKNNEIERNKVAPLPDTTASASLVEQKDSAADEIDISEKTPLNANLNESIDEKRLSSSSNLMSSNSTSSLTKKKVMFALEDCENGNESDSNACGELDDTVSKKKKKEETPEQRAARLLRKKERKRVEQERKAQLALEVQKAEEEARRLRQQEALSAAARNKTIVPEVRVQPDEGEWIVQTKNKALKAALEKEMNEKEKSEKNSHNKNNNKKKENPLPEQQQQQQHGAENEKKNKKKRNKSNKDKTAADGSSTRINSTAFITPGDDQTSPLDLNLRSISDKKNNSNKNSKRNTGNSPRSPKNSPRSPKNSPRDQISFEQKRKEYEARKIKREEEEQRQQQQQQQQCRKEPQTLEEMIAEKMKSNNAGTMASGNMDVGNFPPPGLSMNKNQKQVPNLVAPSDLEINNPFRNKPSLNTIPIGGFAHSYPHVNGNDVRILDKNSNKDQRNTGASEAKPQTMRDFESQLFGAKMDR